MHRNKESANKKKRREQTIAELRKRKPELQPVIPKVTRKKNPSVEDIVEAVLEEFPTAEFSDSYYVYNVWMEQLSLKGKMIEGMTAKGLVLSLTKGEVSPFEYLAELRDEYLNKQGE